jgi:altronate dehydratase large subunit
MGKHPNFAAVLVVGLGCERFTPDEFLNALQKSGKPAEKVVIQHEGDTIKAVEKGVRIAKAFAEKYGDQPRVPCDVSDLIIGLNCGGSDATSGIASNPATGVMSDLTVKHGGSVILSEITELLGCEHILSARAVNPEVGQRVNDCILRMEEHLRNIGTVEKFKNRGALISTGNFDGGVSSVVEKSLGGMHKGGSSQIQEVIDYAEPPPAGMKGLFLMDSPGHDGEVITGMIGGGSQIIIFTTGRGAPTGFPGVPVIKITGNDTTFERMRENMDINAGDIISQGVSLEAKGKEIFDFVLEVANGKKVKAELLGHDELFCITRK